jgi:amino acid permease
MDPPTYHADDEKVVGATSLKASSSDSPDGTVTNTQYGGAAREPFWTRMGVTADSFKRRQATAGSGLNETLKPRHLHMIAIGGSIGAGLFVGSGSALSRGGPGALLVDFLIMGVMMFNVGELHPHLFSLRRLQGEACLRMNS